MTEDSTVTEDQPVTAYRNVSGVPQDLTGGRIVDPGEFVELTEDDQKDEYNKVKLHTGVFAEKVDSPTSEPPPEPPKREELLARAKELEISGVSSMRNDQIQTAILEAENQKGDDA
jgi:hypothetical protein